ncbi:sigma-54-dependent Fis family transcriptional regulator, partial [candidate division KSB1 bacterium]
SSLGIIGRSDEFLKVLETVKQVAPTTINVLITGESGTGKEVIAKAIHALSPRANNPMVNVNCGAIPEGLLESELFGHEKGSFTGATEKRKGYFEIAHTGSLFLDEIGEMPLHTQVRLLRVLETQEFMRVGGTTTLKTDVRVIAATNQNLEDLVAKGEFRKDLFYRLNAVKIHIPPLRKRKEDIKLLAFNFAREFCEKNNIPFKGFSPEALQIMKEYSWPGNIRELKNVIERSIILSKGNQIDKDMIEPHLESVIGNNERALPVIMNKSPDQAERELIYRALVELRLAVEDIRSFIRQNYSHPFKPIAHPIANEVHIAPVNDSNNSDDESLNLRDMEKNMIDKALKKYKGNRRKAAKALGIGERTLYRKIKEHGIEE